jgi:hypothetical protein
MKRARRGLSTSTFASIVACALIASGAAALLTAGPAAGRTTSNNCGKISGIPIHAHDVSCQTARYIYRADMSGHLPGGWSCSASLARCYHGEVGGSDEYMWWRRITYDLVTGPVVLGGKVYPGPNGEGFGTPHPEFIYNGGDASGSISDVRWSAWGGAVAHGRGRHPLFRPRGGYYRRPVVALLKATDLGRCEGHPAYVRLMIKEPRHPGGAFGPWRSWAGPQTICEPYGSSF